MNELYSTKEAAQELGITVAGLWYHIQAGNIHPSKIGKTLVFTQAQLDEFQATRRPAGRPKTEVQNDHHL
jgi:DNA-binding transcriptional MerR regulator